MSIRTRFNPLGTIGRKALLPAGYIELEYLESVGARQYIDTGVVPQPDCIIEADAMFVNPEALSTVYWCRERFGYAGYPSFACISADKPTGNMTLRVYHAMQGDSQTGRYPVQLLAGERFTFKAQYNAFYVNGQQTSLPAQDQYTPATTIGLFWLREDGNWFQQSQPATSSSVRIYRFKVKSASGRLECNLIPALSPTGRPCMFDTVTQQPLYNEGTGEFLYGYKLPRGYEQVDFVTFNGATALDTGIPIATPCWFWCDFQPTIYHQDNVLLGYRIDAAQDTRVGFGMVNYAVAKNAVYFGRGKTFPTAGYRVAMGLDRHTVECRMSLSDVYTAFDGGQLTRVPENQCQAGFDRAVALSSSNHIYIGAAHDGNETRLYWTGKVFGLKFKGENGNVVANIIPARYNGQPCMYDLVRGIKLATVQGNLE